MKKVYTVSMEDRGKRLDIWLCKTIGDISRNQVKRMLDTGCVLVNKKRTYIAGWALKPNDKVEVLRPSKEEGSRSFVNIIYEDRDIVVVDKPAGILSVPQADSPRPNLEEQVKAYLKRKYKTGSYLKALHRLDAETSGVTVFSKSKAGDKLENLFRCHNIERKYIAVVEGEVEKSEGRIDAPLEKGVFGGGKKARTSEGDGGRKAITEYRVKERYGSSTLLEIFVRTGRTHQIRVHLSHIGHPIVGDKLYGRKTPFHRQALHAKTLGFKHPSTGKKMRFESPIPRDMQELIDRFRGI